MEIKIDTADSCQLIRGKVNDIEFVAWVFDEPQPNGLKTEEELNGRVPTLQISHPTIKNPRSNGERYLCCYYEEWLKKPDSEYLQMVQYLIDHLNKLPHVKTATNAN